MKLLRVWAGPMCAAKTTGALQIARRYARQGMHVLLVRPSKSKRSHEGDGPFLRTKDGTPFPAVDVISAKQIFERCAGADVVWIDEPSLFEDEPMLAEVVVDIRRHSIVLVSGLGATSELEPFGQSMPRLLAIADEVNWALADCDACGTHATASRTLYVGEGPKDGQVRVGGAESYVPACPDCWTRLMTFPVTERRSKLR